MKALKTLNRELGAVCHSKQKSIIVLYILNSIFGGLLPIALVLMPRMIVSYVSDGKSYSDLTTVIGIFTAIIVVFGALNALLSNLIQAKSTTFRVNEFINYYRVYLDVPYENMEDPNWLDKAQRQSTALNGDNNGYQSALDVLSKLLPLLVTAIIYIVFLEILSPYIIIGVILLFVLSLIAINKGRNYEYKKRGEETRSERRTNYFSKTASDFTFTKDIKIFNLKDKLLSMLKDEINIFKKLRFQIENHVFLWSVLEVLGIGALFAGTLYFTIDKYESNGNLANLLLNILVVTSLIPVLTNITANFSKLYLDIKEVSEYYDFVDENTRERIIYPTIDINEPLEIEFKNVTFKYPHTEKYILKDVSFKIAKKEKVAIVGINGAGKSTIVKLIIGFFTPNEGEILINGHNVNSFNKEDLYKLYSVVFQDINLYAFSILENISLAKKENTDEAKVRDALNRVEMLDYVESLPHKEDQAMLKFLDPEGVEMSGGQTQKLAIARALYKENSKCVILDEPTAALDALAEAKIYNSFSDLVENKTAIYISHRLSSTKFCDRIMLFDETGLAECGNHTELMKLKGKYFEMFSIQGKYYKEGTENEKLL